MERLQKVIANSGIVSRRKAEDLIQSGKVEVNGKIVKELGVKVSDNDAIVVNRKSIKKENKEYYLLNKPRNVVSTTNDEFNRKSVIDLIDTEARIYPVGRLDYDTTGLIILTNDGELTNILSHPSNNVEKTYIAKVEGTFTAEEIYKIKKGIIIDKVKTIPTKFKVRKVDKVKNNTMVEINIVEGRNHIVKKIFESVNHPVIKLSRVRYGFLELDNLKSGEYRNLSIKEIKKLYNLKK